MGANRPYRSLFWPMLLIGAGVLWLLNNLNLIPGWNWGMLWQLWPVFLIALGLDLLIARRSPILGTLVALATIGLVVILLVAGTSLGLSRRAEVIVEQFSEELGMAESARVDLDFSVGPAFVEALQNSDDLLQADIRHLGEVVFNASGTTRKTIQLDARELSFNAGWFDFTNEGQLRWDVAITPEIPIDLDINGGVGKAELDLRELDLTDLSIDVGVGDVRILLPVSHAGYVAKIGGGVGETYIEIGDGAKVQLEISGGVGEVTIQLPDDAAVRLDASIGVGRVQVPNHFRQISGGDANFVGEDGVWETMGFDAAERRIIIRFDGGVGGLILR